MARTLSRIQSDEIEVRLIDSLTKVFMRREPLAAPQLCEISGLWGETVSFQLAYRYLTSYFSSQMQRQAPKNPAVWLEVDSPLREAVRVRQVVSVPSAYPAYSEYDEDYLTTQPGLFPDLLRELEGPVQIIPFFWRSLWIDVEIPEEWEAGVYPITLRLRSDEGELLKELSLRLKVIGCRRKPQSLIRTEWFYADCLSDYYKVPVFSQRFWELVGNFLEPMTKRGITMLLTPLFSYPLDTLIGRLRTPVQLIGVTQEPEGWRFDFSRLEQWVELARQKGFQYFEMSHLFSQWGAKYPPNIFAEIPGEEQEQQIFGWDTDLEDGRYQRFLASLLPQLTACLRRLGIEKRTYFHISDEPNRGNMDTYRRARRMTEAYLAGFPVIDAMSTLEIYREGTLEHPVPTIDTVGEFLREGMAEPWLYYCSGEFTKVSNRFFAMPSFRTRILGVQMYLYGIRGFLHWGYNFYNSQYSLRHINPYEVTDAGDAFPSGDSFLVYPGADGRPEESLRMMLMTQAVQDMRALETLEEKRGRTFVHDLIRRTAGMEITFLDYPKAPDFLLRLRREVNEALAPN